ncbi:cupin domain-containing protein [Streptomyces sp. NPDC052496]|uniref:cupin domain-containing protein n=1 Tax=Streptomyces sp. NPDC052496 TaxID=3154951 RepID=UPI00344686E3
MSAIDIREAAAVLPAAWSSRPLGKVGAACVKVLRMDEAPGEEEVHGTAEALFVVEGRLELSVGGADVSVGPGELYLVPAGALHAVRAGSRGTLVIFEAVPPVTTATGVRASGGRLGSVLEEFGQ